MSFESAKCPNCGAEIKVPNDRKNAAGVSAGNIILTAAVLAILISAPLGAIGIESSYRHLLEREK